MTRPRTPGLLPEPSKEVFVVNQGLSVRFGKILDDGKVQRLWSLFRATLGIYRPYIVAFAETKPP